MKILKLSFAAIVAFCAANFNASAQCGPFATSDVCNNIAAISMPTTLNACPGIPVTFTPTVSMPGLSAPTYSWTPTAGVAPAAAGAGLPPSTSITPPLPPSPPACGTIVYPYVLKVTGLGPNIILNGNFNAGNVGFCSNYGYTPSPPPGASSPCYTTSVSTLPYAGFAFLDHTAPGSSSMMYIQSTYNFNIIWKQNVNVCPGAQYNFAFWHATLHTSPALNTIYAIMQDATGTFTAYGPFTSTTFDTWKQHTLTWNNPAGGAYTTATMYITATAGLGAGGTNINNFALDDITCNRVSTASATVNVRVNYPTITGPKTVCVGSSVSLTGCTGGSWSSSAPTVAAVTSTGVVTGISAGTTTITYISSTGCATSTSITVYPAAPAITGPASVCLGSSIVWTTGTSATGTWNCTGGLSTTASGSLSSATFTGVSVGTGMITLTDPSTRCFSTGTVTVNPIPVINGPTVVCQGVNITFSSTSTGYWTCTSGLINVSGTGPSSTCTFQGSLTGPATITFVDAATGCSTTASVLVNLTPVITGPTSVCTGSTIAWSSSTTAGHWTTTGGLYNYSGGLVTSTATVLGTVAGAATITLTDTATGCFATSTITVNQTPSGMATQYLCLGYPLTMTNTVSGGAFTSTNTGVATIDPITGVVSTVAPGATYIKYTMPGSGCATGTWIYVYDCAGGGGLVGSAVCQGSSMAMILASGIPSGGTWSSSNTAAGTVDPITGVVTGVSGGTTVISYTAGPTTWSTTISVIASATACVTTSTAGGTYSFVFTSTCSSTATIYYTVKNPGGAILGYQTTTAGTLPITYLTSIYGPTANVVCVTGVYCNGCYYPANCCAGSNYLKPSSSEENNAITETNGNAQFAIAPNPSNGSFVLSGNIANTTEKSVDFQITDMLGKTVYSDVADVENGAVNNNISLDSKLPNGIYFIKIKNEAGGQVIRFVLSR